MLRGAQNIPGACCCAARDRESAPNRCSARVPGTGWPSKSTPTAPLRPGLALAPPRRRTGLHAEHQPGCAQHGEVGSNPLGWVWPEAAFAKAVVATRPATARVSVLFMTALLNSPVRL